MKKEKTWLINNEEEEKTSLGKMWSHAAPYAIFMVICLAVPLAILAIKHKVADEELRAAVDRRALPSFSFRPKVPTSGQGVRIVPNGFLPDRSSYSYKWWLNGYLVENYTKDTFPDLGLKRGDEIRVAVLNPEGRVISTRAVMVANNLPALKSLKFKPLPLSRDRDLKVTVDAEDLDGDSVSTEYAWLVNNEPVIGETQSVLPHANFERGDEVRARITIHDGRDSKTVLSAPVLVMNSPPMIVSKPPPMIAQGTYTYQVEARDSEGDPLRYALGGNPPPGMKINPEAGIVTWDAQIPKKPTRYAYQVIVRDGFNGRCVQNIFLEFR